MSRTLKLMIRGQVELPCKMLLADADDTLISTRLTAFSKIRLVAQRLGLPIPTLGDFLAAYNSISYPAYIKEVLHTELSLDRVLRLYDQVHHEAGGYKLLPGVADLFSELHSAGVPIGILTNASSAKIQQKMEAVEDYITDIWCCGEKLPAKPHPDCLLSVFRKYPELRPAEIVFIGDSLIDWRTVCDSQVNFIAVLTGSHTRVDFEGAGVPRNMIIEDMTHLRVVRA